PVIQTELRGKATGGRYPVDYTFHLTPRNLIERFFCRINQFRRVATRYDKLSELFASFVALTAAFIWLY
ncbi:hypothetical protein CE195_04260, partial [Sodalis-like symbiont of Philaenus spumarius]